MSVPRTDVLVIGGGIIGAAVADAVAAGGTPVVLLERAQVGSAASSGAAGLLAPLVEAEGPGPFLELALAGRALFRDAAAALLRDTGVDVGYRETGTLRVAEDDGVARELRHRVSWERERGLHVGWPEADGRVPLVNAALHIVGRPAALILKQANAADRLIIAQVEPMLRAARDVDQIT